MPFLVLYSEAPASEPIYVRSGSIGVRSFQSAKIKKNTLFILLFFLGKLLAAQNLAPTITNLTVATDFHNNTITLNYNLEGLENNEVEIYDLRGVLI